MALHHQLKHNRLTLSYVRDLSYLSLNLFGGDA
ncbi:Uncharacterised protein [Enterobacter hormaechei]|nr:Uncharacterised protein [Enterobacter hormaechei]